MAIPKIAKIVVNMGVGEAIANSKVLDTAVEEPVSYTHLRAHETVLDLVCRLLLEKKKHLYKPQRA